MMAELNAQLLSGLGVIKRKAEQMEELLRQSPKTRRKKGKLENTVVYEGLDVPDDGYKWKSSGGSREKASKGETRDYFKCVECDVTRTVIRTAAQRKIEIRYYRNHTCRLAGGAGAIAENEQGNEDGTPTDSFYEIRAGCTDVPKTNFRIKSGKTLIEETWRAAFTPEGSLDIGKCLNRIYRGGIHPSIRGEVWEFLLGCYNPKSTFDERKQIQERRRQQYAALKESCSCMFPVVGSGKFVTAPVIKANGDPVQEPIPLLGTNLHELPTPQLENVGPSPATEDSREHDQEIIQWKLALHIIGLDVDRTDRTLTFYEKQKNLAKLWDVLAVYAWYNKDVGYGQGMSDLCSPMIMLLENEADAFWCFERLMRKSRGNFRCTANSVGLEAQPLDDLANVTQVVNRKLHQHLESLGGGGYQFAFQMLMVLFRRELSFGDSLYLWEMMWALEYNPELFSLYEGGEAHDKSDAHRITRESKHQYGKYERANRKNQAGPIPISVFVVASVLKDRSNKLLTEARGLDDVVKILNDISGNMDAKKACRGAMKIHKKYLKRKKRYNTR